MKAECTKKIVVVSPLEIKNKYIPVPAWVGEACKGLLFRDMKENEDGTYSVGINDFVMALTSQKPRLRSIEAALWLRVNMWPGLGVKINQKDVEVRGCDIC